MYTSAPWLRSLAATGLAAVLAAATLASSPAIAVGGDGETGFVGAVPAPTSTTLTAAQALAESRISGKPVAVSGATTPTDLVTANPNGTLTLSRALAPVRKRVDGQWKDLDATLVRNPDGTISPAVSTTPVVLSAGGTGPLAKLSGAGKSFEVGLPMQLPAPTLSGDTATYTDVVPGVDVVAKVSKFGGFSEVVVVRDAAAAANPAVQKLVLSTKADGLTLAADAAGNITGKDTVGKTVLATPSALMWDSSANLQARMADADAPALSTTDGPGAAAQVAKLKTSVSASNITLTVDSNVLKGSSTRYPVYIDPSFTWTPVSPTLSGWATLPVQYPSSNYWKNTPDPDGRLQAGRSTDGWMSRTLLNFAVPVSTLSGATISSAVINMTETRSGSCTPKVINLHAPGTDLTSANATWDYWNGISHGSVVDSKNVAYGYNDSCKAAGVSFTVTNTIKADVTANNTTRTFMLKAGDESDEYSYKEFDLSTVKMTVQYNHVPNTPTGMSTSPTTSCAANPSTAVGDGQVSLYAPVSDKNGGTLGVEFKLWKTPDATETALASTDPAGLTYGSGTTAVFNVSAGTLRTAASGAITEFSWKVRTTDYPADKTDASHFSAWSAVCKFRFDPTRAGAPTVAVASGAQIGQPVDVTITKPASGSVPTGYLVQVNAGKPINVTVDGSGNGTVKITPTRFTNTVSVTSLSTGGNIGDAASAIFNATPAAPAQPDDFTGDDAADLIAVGGSNGLPPGVWHASGVNNGQINVAGNNIGVYGNGVTGAGTAAEFNGAQVTTGTFTGNGLQDILAYYPTGTNAGGGSIIAGNGDGSPLQAYVSGNQYTFQAGDLLDENDANPLQIANAGNASGQGLAYPDLIAVSGKASNYYLSYFVNQDGIGNYTFPTVLSGVKTPAGDMKWNEWTIATAQLASGTAMFLRHTVGGKLYLWTSLAYDIGAYTFTYTQHMLKDSGWKTNTALGLQAADIDRDGDADLWTIEAGGIVNAHLVKDLPAAPTVEEQPAQTLITANHAWLLNDATSGTVAANGAKDLVGTLHASGNTGTTWKTGDLFSPDVEFNGTSGTITAGKAVTTNADFTISVWAKPTTGGTVLSQDGTNTAGFKLWAEPSDKSWRFAMSQTDVASPVWDTASAPAGTAPLGVWSQVTVTYKAATGLVILYVNGDNKASTSHTVKWNAAGSTRMGAHKTSSVGGYFGGQLAYVQTWNQIWQKPTPANHDFDGDGRNDVIITDGAGDLWMYPNQGGTGMSTLNTSARVKIGSGWGSLKWVISDWDADGDADVIASTTDGNLWWYPNVGGYFGSRQQIGTSWTNLTHAAANADSNPHADLFGINNSSGVFYYYPNGSGKTTIGASGWANYRIFPADFNNDNRTDVMAIDPAGALWLYPHSGQSGTGMLGARTSAGTGWTPYKVTAADINGDGKTDLVALDSSKNLWVYPGNGSGAFGSRYQIGSNWTVSTLG